MKTICLTFLAGFAWLGLFSTPSHAAPEGRPYHATTVRWVVSTRDNLDMDDRYVTLVGHATRRIGDNEYWFTDGTGSVRLDSADFDLPIGERIVIGGRIDQAYLGFGHLEVDVRHWHPAPVRKHVAAPASAPTAAAPEKAPSAPAAPTTAAPAETSPASAAPAAATPSSTAPASETTTGLTPPSDASTNAAPASTSTTPSSESAPTNASPVK